MSHMQTKAPFTSMLALLLGTFLAMTTFSSCAPKSAKVTTGIGIVSSMSFINSSGGTLVAGQHNDGWSFSRYFPAGENIVVEMELGIWNLAVVTYSGTDAASSATTECASGEFRVSDSGEDVNIKVSAANCAKAGVNKIRMRACTEDSFESSGTSTAMFCVPDGATSGGDSLGLRSYKVAYLSQENSKPLEQAPAFSSCINEANLEDGEMMLFTGENSVIKNVPLAFYFYPSTDCSGNGRIFRTKPNLIDQENKSLLKTAYLYSVANTKMVFVNADSAVLNIPEPANNAPVILSQKDHILAKRNTLINFTASDHFSDLEYDTITYSCFFDKKIDGKVNILLEDPCSLMSASDGSFSFNSSTGEFNWSIGTNAADSYEFKIVAYDGDLRSHIQFIVNTMDSSTANNPDTDSLEVWLEPKSSYLYSDIKGSTHALQGDNIAAWRNKAVKGSEKPLVARTPYGNGPVFQIENNISAAPGTAAYSAYFDAQPTLGFRASSNTALALHGGDYDQGDRMTIMVYFTRNTKSVSNLNNIFSKANSGEPGVSFEGRLTKLQTPEVLHSSIVGGQNVEASSNPVENSRVCLSYTINLDNLEGNLYLGTQSLPTQYISTLNSLDFKSSTEPLIIGNKLIEDGTRGLDGNIAEVLIWSKELSETQIQTECTRLEDLYSL